jgi:hypothetical protein
MKLRRLTKKEVKKHCRMLKKQQNEIAKDLAGNKILYSDRDSVIYEE